MLLKLTTKCSMGCSHCLSDCKPDGINMTKDTLVKVIDFIKKNDLNDIYFPIVLSGGEIFEHDNVIELIDMILFNLKNYIVITTNGDILSNNDKYIKHLKNLHKDYKKRLTYQVTVDSRYYPKILTKEQTKKLQKLNNIIFDPVDNLYPQGRALVNHVNGPWHTLCPKCTNIRLFVKQGFKTLKQIIDTLTQHHKFCTFQISPLGEIKLGESDLCPAIADITMSEDEIIKKIDNMKCQQCFIPLVELYKLDYNVYRLLLGENNNEDLENKIKLKIRQQIDKDIEEEIKQKIVEKIK